MLTHDAKNFLFSPKPVPEAVPEVSSQDIDTTDSHREPDFAPFPEVSIFVSKPWCQLIYGHLPQTLTYTLVVTLHTYLEKYALLHLHCICGGAFIHTTVYLRVCAQSSTPLLDTSAQRSKANLGRRRSRTRPSRSLRLAQAKSPNWRVHDSTGY